MNLLMGEERLIFIHFLCSYETFRNALKQPFLRHTAGFDENFNNLSSLTCDCTVDMRSTPNGIHYSSPSLPSRRQEWPCCKRRSTRYSRTTSDNLSCREWDWPSCTMWSRLLLVCSRSIRTWGNLRASRGRELWGDSVLWWVCSSRRILEDCHPRSVWRIRFSTRPWSSLGRSA